MGNLNPGRADRHRSVSPPPGSGTGPVSGSAVLNIYEYSPLAEMSQDLLFTVCVLPISLIVLAYHGDHDRLDNAADMGQRWL